MILIWKLWDQILQHEAISPQQDKDQMEVVALVCHWHSKMVNQSEHTSSVAELKF